MKVLNVCSDLCESSLRAYDEADSSNNAASASQLSSARLTTQVNRIENRLDFSGLASETKHFQFELFRGASEQRQILNGKTNVMSRLPH